MDLQLSLLNEIQHKCQQLANLGLLKAGRLYKELQAVVAHRPIYPVRLADLQHAPTSSLGSGSANQLTENTDVRAVIG